MTVRVLFFALARELAGRDDVEVEMPDGATVADLRRRLAEEHTRLAKLLPRCMIAVNQQYSADTSVIPPGAEIACIPPVSGG